MTAKIIDFSPQNHEQSFIDAMVKAGCAPADNEDIIADAEDHYYRLAGDKKDKRGGYCLTILSDGFAYGNFRSFKTGDCGSWHSGKGVRGLTKEQRAANEARLKVAEAEKEARREEIYAVRALEAKALWEASPPAVERHPYLVKKGIKPNGARQDGEDLIIQMVSGGKTCSYQRIQPDGFKLYMAGARKQGAYGPIATAGDDKKILVICEGFATGASIREATGLPVIVAFDAGNLAPVAVEIRKKYPESVILIAADNDADGETNTGRVKGEAAAAKINGFCIWPEFPEGVEGTDYNDLHATKGLEAVKNRILAAVVARDEVVGRAEVSQDEGVQPPDHDIPPAPFEDMGSPTQDDDGNINIDGDMGLPFKILGYDDDTHYYFPFGKQKIHSFSASGHTMNNLIQLASLQQWKDWAKRSFDVTIGPKEVPLYALDAMTRISTSRGVFNPHSRIRGCGVWKDTDKARVSRVILHCGDKLLVNGVLTSPSEIKSHYVYAAAEGRFKHHAEPLSTAEAHKLRTICTMPTWENPLSGHLLAGWLVVASVCAALEWRPHIFITGESGAGKSTILNEIIKRTLTKISLNVDGGTTESSLREKLGYDAIPIIYDEAGKRNLIMDGVLALAQISSTGGNAGKRGQKSAETRSCFCFSAVNPPIKDYQTETRISIMNLRRNTSDNAQKHYDDLMEAIENTLTPEYSRSLLARTVANMHNLLANIKTFKKAANTVIKNARAADQVSTMLGGLYMLGSTGLITIQEAEKWISERDWSEHTAIGEENESERLINHISTSIITVKDSRGSRDHTIGTLIACAINKSGEADQETSKNILKNYAILARWDGIFIGYKNQNLAKILKDTDWENGWSRALARLPGSSPVSSQYFGCGSPKQRAVKLPVKLFVDEAAPSLPLDDREVEIPIE